MGGVSSQGGHGRRAHRDGAVVRAPLAPLAAWVVLALGVTAAVLLVAGLSGPTVAWLLAAGALLGGVLLAAVRLSPPPAGPDGPGGDVGGGDGSAP